MDKERFKEARERKQELLAHQTKAERHFAQILRNLKIRSQPQAIFFLDDYHYRIVDFYIPKPYRVIVELDGSVHDSQEAKSYDEWKDRKLITRNHKFNILRFKNDEVFSLNFQNRFSSILGLNRLPNQRFRHRRRFKKRIKHFHKKPVMNGKVINLGWRIVEMSRERNSHVGLRYQPGYTLAEMRAMGYI